MLHLLFTLALAQTPTDAPTEAPPAAVEELSALETVQAVYEQVDRLKLVEVTRHGGVVRLQGEVPDDRSRQEAVKLAESIPDTTFLDNLIVVRPVTPPPEQRDEKDAAIQARLSRIYARVKALQKVDVTVDAGVVTLKGEVLNSDDRDRAIALAEKSEGVTFVANEMVAPTDVRARLGPAVDSAWEQIRGVIAAVPLLLVGLLILGLFVGVGGWLSRQQWLLRRFSERRLIQATVSRVIRIIAVLAGALITLELLDATGLVGAVMGAAGVMGIALGFAFQDVVENYLAGLLLTLQQPFRQDDLIEIGSITGTVVRLTTRNTLLLSPDGNHIFVPNADVFKSALINYSRNPRRRFDFTVGVGVEEDLKSVIKGGLEALNAMEGVLADPAPTIRIQALGDSSVVMEVFGWVDQTTHNFLAVRTEAIRRIKEAYEDLGFDMPEPIYRVTMTQMPTPTLPRPSKRTPDDAPAVDISADTELLDQVKTERNREPHEDLLT